MKPAKPYPDFPLFPHATGRWAKKINGRFAFFGPWADPHAALERYLAERDDLYAGRAPRRRSGPSSVHGTPSAVRRVGGRESGGSEAGDLSVRDLVNHFLTAKQRRVDGGEMGARSFNDYHRTAARVVKSFGVHRLVDDLAPGDFGLLRSELAADFGPVVLGNHIGRVRSIFKHGYESGLLEKPVRFGPEFGKPNKRTMRLARAARGPRMFEPSEIKQLLDGAGEQMRAMVLLGINCGMGNTDVASLTRGAVDLKKAVIDFPRPKTGIARRCVLWPETVEALRAVEKRRPKPREAEHADLVFMTKYGQPWVRVGEPGERSKGKNTAVVKDSVTTEFAKLQRAVGIEPDGRGFYGLRHTFRTVADEVGDRRAVDLIMGHENGQDIANSYVERVADERLWKVAEHVRKWCLGVTSRQVGRGKRGS
jgi:integrase